MVALLLWAATSALASWPPLQDVQAGKETSGSTTTVWYKVYDPVLETWVEGDESYDSSFSIEVTNTDGVVAWLARKGTSYSVGYAVYDPARREWRGDIRGYTSGGGYSYSVSQLENDNGGVCWHVRDNFTDPEFPDISWRKQRAVYAVYDPKEAIWKTDDTTYTEVGHESYSGFQLMTQEGVVAWTVTETSSFGEPFSSYILGYAVYDPASNGWQTGRDMYSNRISSLAVQNTTLHYQVDDTDHVKGYDPSAGSWYDGTTKPLAYFAASPMVGFIPLRVWCTDMSIGASSWDWDFGVGEHSSERSPLHIFSHSGDYTVTQAVTGPQGSDFTVILIRAAEPSTEEAKTGIYVDDDAIGANDGSSWENAYASLQDALTDAESVSGPTGIVEVLVAQGIYTPDQGIGITPRDRTATFQLVDYVTLKGGFAGLGEPDPNARDLAAYETILSGDLNMNDVDVNDPEEMKDEPTRAENSYHVVTGSGTGETAILDGFTITGGNANAYSGTHSYGGGMYNVEGDPTLTDCLFVDNSVNGMWARGGGMYNDHSGPTLAGCTFITNYSSASRGGGIYNSDSSPMLTSCTFDNNYPSGMYSGHSDDTTVTNCTFNDNHHSGMYSAYSDSITARNCTFSNNGSGMYFRNSGNSTVTNCTFSNNNGSGMYSESSSSNSTVRNCTFTSNNGNGMYSSNSGNSTVTNCTFSNNNGSGMRSKSSWNSALTNCTFSNNSAKDGGGMYLDNSDNSVLTDCIFMENSADDDGGGIYSTSNYSYGPTLVNCIFIGNSAGNDGGGMCNIYHGNPILINCTFRNNLANGDGGGMYNDRSTSTLTNCIFSRNYTYGVGGGIYNYGVGGGMYRIDTSLTLTSCTFMKNVAQHGNALSFDSSWDNYGSDVKLANCILWDDGNEIWNNDNSIIEITYSDVYGGFPGTGNIDADPLFADPGYWDPNGTSDDPNDDVWIDGDYHLKSEFGRWDREGRSWVLDDVTSPCIDAGDPDSGSGGELWPHGGRINMGAYGGTAEASMSLSMVGNIADFGKDDAVDRMDVLILADGWLSADAPLAEDANRDGLVNFFDFRVLADNWLWGQ